MSCPRNKVPGAATGIESVGDSRHRLGGGGGPPREKKKKIKLGGKKKRS